MRQRVMAAPSRPRILLETSSSQFRTSSYEDGCRILLLQTQRDRLAFTFPLSPLQDYLQGDSSKAHQRLGWKPKVTFEVRVTQKHTWWDDEQT